LPCNRINGLSVWLIASMFVFDTSTLLNLYEYSEESKNDIIESVLKKLSGKLWLPFNVKKEYSKDELPMRFFLF
jgi:hypothetical protein